jgi:predicted O-linked N-acetylglucosamine transferase (SPINDLY family)
MQLHQQGRLAEAEGIYRQVLSIQPDHPDALHLLGILASQQGRRDEAVELIGRAVALKPLVSGYHGNLGNALAEAGRGDDAVAAFGKAISLDPTNFQAAYSLGTTLESLGRIDEAIAAFQQALALKPDSAEAHNNLGIALRNAGRLDEAFAALIEAQRIFPSSANVQTNLAMVHMDCAQHNEGIAAYDRALALEPPTPDRLSSRIAAMHYHPLFDARDILREARRWDELFSGPLRSSIRPHSNDRNPGRKLRIGYVSPDLRQHVVGRCILSVLPHHDQRQVEIYCYANVGREDATSAELRGHCAGWRNIHRTFDQRAAEMIRADGIDILVDLAVHTQGNRLPLFARKPAPVQMTYLGCCSTTGLSAMDYRLSDLLVDPPETDLSVYSEKTIRLPRTHLCYEPLVATPEVSARSGEMTFGCMNNFAKCSTAAIDLWIEILRAVPDSRFILHAKPGRYLESVKERFERAGVSRERLEFVGQVSWPEFFQTFARIDISLDPIPYNGAITTCDSLWMGVPVVTLSGKTAVGRMGGWILSSIGLPELIASHPREYVRIAVELANNSRRLNELRDELRPRLRNSPLMNPAQLARDLEAAFRAAWTNFCGEKRA